MKVKFKCALVAVGIVIGISAFMIPNEAYGINWSAFKNVKSIVQKSSALVYTKLNLKNIKEALGLCNIEVTAKNGISKCKITDCSAWAEGDLIYSGSKTGVCYPKIRQCANTGTTEGILTDANLFDYVPPTAEKCNGLDDDCDGVVDDNVVMNLVDNPAEKQEGVCKGQVKVCNKGVPAEPDYGKDYEPIETKCDGKDNDCDGSVDYSKGWVNKLAEGCFSDVVPKDKQGVGICTAGKRECTSGTWGTCTGFGKPALELCNELDDDCDGPPVDEDFIVLGKGKYCSVGKGICNSVGKYVCSTDGHGLVCSAKIESTATVNGISLDPVSAVPGPKGTKTVAHIQGTGTEPKGLACIGVGFTVEGQDIAKYANYSAVSGQDGTAEAVVYLTGVAGAGKITASVVDPSSGKKYTASQSVDVKEGSLSSVHIILDRRFTKVGEPVIVSVSQTDDYGNQLSNPYNLEAPDSPDAVIDEDEIVFSTPGTKTIRATAGSYSAYRKISVLENDSSVSITYVSPEVGVPGTFFRIVGTNFDNGGGNAVTLNGNPITCNTVNTVSLSCKLPKDPKTKSGDLAVAVQGQGSAKTYFEVDESLAGAYDYKLAGELGYVPGLLIVSYKNGVPSKDQLKAYGGYFSRQIYDPHGNQYSAYLKDSSEGNMKSVLESLWKDGNVRYAVRERVPKPLMPPPLSKAPIINWAYITNLQLAKKTLYPEKGMGVKIAVIDMGFPESANTKYSESDIFDFQESGKYFHSFEFNIYDALNWTMDDGNNVVKYKSDHVCTDDDGEYHGFYVSLIAGGADNPYTGVEGIAPSAQIEYASGADFEECEPFVTHGYFLMSRYIEMPVDVINMSFGNDVEAGTTMDSKEYIEEREYFRDVIVGALEDRMELCKAPIPGGVQNVELLAKKEKLCVPPVLVHAAGNSRGKEGYAGITETIAATGLVIDVGGTDTEFEAVGESVFFNMGDPPPSADWNLRDKVSVFSSYGDVDFVAPVENVVIPGWSGTSDAAPQVAGLVALILSSEKAKPLLNEAKAMAKFGMATPEAWHKHFRDRIVEYIAQYHTVDLNDGSMNCRENDTQCKEMIGTGKDPISGYGRIHIYDLYGAHKGTPFRLAPDNTISFLPVEEAFEHYVGEKTNNVSKFNATDVAVSKAGALFVASNYEAKELFTSNDPYHYETEVFKIEFNPFNEALKSSSAEECMSNYGYYLCPESLEIKSIFKTKMDVDGPAWTNAIDINPYGDIVLAIYEPNSPKFPKGGNDSWNALYRGTISDKTGEYVFLPLPPSPPYPAWDYWKPPDTLSKWNSEPPMGDYCIGIGDKSFGGVAWNPVNGNIIATGPVGNPKGMSQGGGVTYGSGPLGYSRVIEYNVTGMNCQALYGAYSYDISFTPGIGTYYWRNGVQYEKAELPEGGTYDIGYYASDIDATGEYIFFTNRKTPTGDPGSQVDKYSDGVFRIYADVPMDGVIPFWANGLAVCDGDNMFALESENTKLMLYGTMKISDVMWPLEGDVYEGWGTEKKIGLDCLRSE